MTYTSLIRNSFISAIFILILFIIQIPGWFKYLAYFTITLIYVLFLTKAQPNRINFRLYSAFFFIYYTGGLLVYLVREINWYNYPGDIDKVAQIGYIAFIFYCVGYFLFYNLSQYFSKYKNKKRNYVVTINQNRISILSSIFFVIGFVFSLLIFKTNIPLLSNDIDSARVILSETTSRFMPGFMILFQVFFLQYEKKVVNTQTILLITCSLLLLTLNGSRFYIMFPFLVIIIRMVLDRKISVLRLGVIAVIFVLFSMIMISYRLFHEFWNINAVFADMFPEMRTFALALTAIPVGEFGGHVFYSVIAGLFPSSFLGLLGLDKTLLYTPIGAYILGYFPQFSGILGLRISLIGEIYLSLGTIGVFVVFSLLGICTAILDLLKDYSNFIKSIILTLLMLLIPYGSIFLITLIQISSVAIVVFLFIKRCEQSLDHSH